MKQSPRAVSLRAERRHQKLLRRRRRALRYRTRGDQRAGGRHNVAGDQVAVVPLEAPEIFGMYRHRSHRTLVGFVRQLVRLTLRRHQTVEIDFRPVKHLAPDGTLLVFAEVQRILKHRPGCLRFVRAVDKTVDETLCHLGFYRAMGSLRTVTSENPDVIHWQAVMGTRGGTEIIGPMIKDQNRLPEDKRRGLVKSISEAITNVTQHAYDEPRQEGTGLAGDCGWWAFIREEKAELSVAFCDLGLGVPVTAPKKLGERLLGVLKLLGPAVGRRSHQDAQYIAATVEDSRTRTMLDHRGKGFRDIMETWKQGGEGYVQIFSNRGCYYSHVEKGVPRHDMRNYRESIHGTLIAWRLTLQKEAT